MSQQTAQLMEMIHEVTGQCFDKCFKDGGGAKMTGADEMCVKNCAQRVHDVKLFINRRVQTRHLGKDGDGGAAHACRSALLLPSLAQEAAL